MKKNTVTEVQQPKISVKNNQNPSTSAGSSGGKNIEINTGSTKANVERDDTSTITQLIVPEISIQDFKPIISSQVSS